jgi:hypothetical protein
MRYDFAKDTMLVDGNAYPLKPYRKWLMDNHERLVQGHFIKALHVDGKTKFYYDWQAVYFLAEEYLFLNSYLKTLA